MEHKRNKKILSLSFGLGVLLLGTVESGAVTIKEAVQSAVQGHPLVLAAEQQVLSDAQEIVRAEGNYYPTLKVNANFGGEDQDTQAKGAASSTNKEFDDGYHVEAVLAQNIFNGFGDVKGVEKARAAHQARIYDKKVDIDQLTFDVVGAYLEIVRLREVLKLDEESIAKYEDYLVLARKKAKGTGRKSEPVTVNSKLQRLQSEYMRHTWELKRQNEKFIQLTGLEPDLNMKAELLPLVEQNSLDEILGDLEVKNNKLNSFLAKIDGKSAEEKVGEAAFYPKLDLVFKGYMDEDIETFETKTEQTSVMLNLTFNLFNGWKDRAGIEKSKMDRLKLENEYRKEYIELVEKIKIKHDQYLTWKERVEILAGYINIQERLPSLYRAEFKDGKRSIVNLVDSQQDLRNARISYINTYIAMVKSTYEIIEAMGSLNEAVKGTELKSAGFVALD